ncbi:unnamed protein product [Effrenium voratum]|uniref:Ribonuclease n=1 Tax=Effrenium voratum TaxID=2562239 RepID=A0AA36ILJ8_9DINO|nr:unnamed protein product [Effrenium voratum]
MGSTPNESDSDAKGAGLGAWERRLWQTTDVVIGVDEAGRGPLAGPAARLTRPDSTVVAAAFAALSQDDEVLDLLSRVNDSKQLAEQQREQLFQELTDPKFKKRVIWAIAESSAAEIDATNILQASLSAMARAVRLLELGERLPESHVLVDGCNRPPELLHQGEKWTRLSQRDLEARKNQQKLSQFFASVPSQSKGSEHEKPKEVEAVIQGDGRVPSISAASIIAKVHRDRLMEAMDREHPAFGFKLHKGYGTEAHLQAIRTHGICHEHRKTFGPVRLLLEQKNVDICKALAATPKRSNTEMGLAKSPPKEGVAKKRKAKKR